MKLEPVVLPESQPFWDGAAERKLRIQSCDACDEFYFPPAPLCPKCSSRNTRWRDISGRASLYSYSITPTPFPQWNRKGPMVVALVQLEEGPRLISTLVECDADPATLRIDMRLEAVWVPFGDQPNMLCFRPTGSEISK